MDGRSFVLGLVVLMSPWLRRDDGLVDGHDGLGVGSRLCGKAGSLRLDGVLGMVHGFVERLDLCVPCYGESHVAV